MKSKSTLSRRKFLDLGLKTSAAAAALSAAPMPAWASREYGGYSGNKNYKYIKSPATVYDWGLTPDQEARAKELHKKLVIFDNLIECTFYPELIDNVLLGGGTAGNLSLGITDMFGWTPGNQFTADQWWSWEALSLDLARLPGLMDTFSDKAMLALNHDDILEAKKLGKVGFMPGTQNSNFMEDNIDRLNLAHGMGLRIVQIVYNSTNSVGSGSMEPTDQRFGLSKLGENVVGRLNDLNMMVDTGHASSETQIRAAEVSEKPIAISHAGMSSMVDQFRASSDKAIKAVAEKGGVIGILSTPAALNGKDRCTVADYVDNLEHLINIAGIDHVGIGSDFIIPSTFDQILSAPDWTPEIVASIGEFEVWPWSDGHVGFENNSGYPNLTRGFVKRGYSDEDIAKIMGGNWMRLIKETIG